MVAIMTHDEIRSAMRGFGKTAPEDIERSIRALVDGGAAAHITAARPITSGSYLGLMGDQGVRIAWLHVGHIDILDEYAPDYAFPSGAYAGISRVAFPGYAESSSPTNVGTTPLPCQVCFNAEPWCECE